MKKVKFTCIQFPKIRISYYVHIYRFNFLLPGGQSGTDRSLGTGTVHHFCANSVCHLVPFQCPINVLSQVFVTKKDDVQQRLLKRLNFFFFLINTFLNRLHQRTAIGLVSGEDILIKTLFVLYKNVILLFIVSLSQISFVISITCRNYQNQV